MPFGVLDARIFNGCDGSDNTLHRSPAYITMAFSEILLIFFPDLPRIVTFYNKQQYVIDL